MSFLPHAAPSGAGWYGSMAASALAHAGIVAIFVSGAVAFLPEPVVTELREPEFAVSLEILDAEVVEELDAIDEAGVIPDDAVPLAPEDLVAEGEPDAIAALSPDTDLLTPEADTLLPDNALTPEEPEVIEAEPEVIAPEPEVLQPEPEAVAPEPQVIEPEPEIIAPEPEVAAPEPEVIDPEPVAPEPEVVTPEPEPELAEDVPALPVPVAPLPADPAPLAIDNISPIDDTVVSPLADGGAAPAPQVIAPEDDVVILGETGLATPQQPDPTPQEDELALLLPEPEPEPEAPAPAVDDPEPTPEPQPQPEPEPITEAEPETDTPDAGNAEATGDDAPLGTPEGEDDQTAVVERTPVANPTESDIAIGQLLRRIRDVPQPQCTLALPRRASGTPGAGISFVGADPETLDTLALQIIDGLPFEPVQTREEIDLRQCALLDALRQSESYPASRIGLAIDSTTLTSGDTLSGRVIGAGGLFVTLLLIDDNGVVQDMAPFVTIDGRTPVFEAPVARSGPSRATRQILVALGTPTAPLDIQDLIGNDAQTVFTGIPSDTLQSLVFGVATFDVR